MYTLHVVLPVHGGLNCLTPLRQLQQGPGGSRSCKLPKMAKPLL